MEIKIEISDKYIPFLKKLVGADIKAAIENRIIGELEVNIDTQYNRRLEEKTMDEKLAVIEG